METFFKARYLFDIDAMANTNRKLRNIANGLVAPSTASVTNIKECGDKILQISEIYASGANTC